MNWIRSLTIKKKLTLFFLVFFCIPFLIIGVIWYNKSTQTIENSAVYYNTQWVRQLNKRLDEYFARIKLDTQTLPGDPRIQQFVKYDPSDAYSLYLLKQEISQEVYPKIAYGNNEFAGFYMYSLKGAVLGDQIADRLGVNFRDFNEQEESFKVIGIQKVGGVPVVMVQRGIFDNVTFSFAGAMIYAFSLERMLDMGDSRKLGDDDHIAIIDAANRQFLYHSDSAKWGEEVPSGWRDKLEETGGYFIDRTSEDHKMIVYHTSEATGMTLASEVPLNQLVGTLPNLRTITVIVGLVILALAFITFNKILLEVKRLVEVIHLSRIEHKDMELKQREARLQALQSQINPHFLYNSLEIINSYAVVAKIRPISQMTVMLAGMFRYSASDPQHLVPLREEIHHIRNYLRIQQERYELLRFQITVEDRYLDQVQLFRLILQPIVENVIIHAYENHGLHPGEVLVTGQPADGCFKLQVIDKGRGMAPDTMAKFNAAFDSEDVESAGKAIRQIGLWNVHSRLRLAFGSPYGLHILHSDEAGTCLEIRLPYHSTDEISA
ncbi:sensor histidine kinase [Paenibacillus sp. J2TS4]|uniref:sensor histidine kinase n=1 Tax=Paenibacillus sp. J2TS4 TaxID=2807194 RepID=UPI001B18324E|nr:sensor histidine kinase [Paenibacillus sp. J2TS4]GIP35806.1 sensor histidine kinase YesM [Paenibacillus sp. J2TS4]